MTSERARQSVEWVVVDTNVLGAGRLQVDQIEGLADELLYVDVEVVVPEVVLWEWAEHARRDLVGLEETARQLRKRLGRAGLEDLHPAASVAGSEIPDVQEIVDRMRERLEELSNVLVLPTTPEAALAGLRSQVLQTGAGCRKPAVNGTKTGAADAAWVYDALRLADGDPTRLAFLTKDSDPASACRAHGVEPPRTFGSRIAAVNALRDLVEEVRRELVRELAAYVLDEIADEARREALARSLFVPSYLVRRGHNADPFVISCDVSAVHAVVGVRYFRTDGALATVVVDLLVDLETISVALEIVGNRVARTEHGAILEVPLSARFERDGHVTGLVPAGPGIARIDLPLEYRDFDNSLVKAVNALTTVLGEFPTLPDEDWWQTLFATGAATPTDGLCALDDQPAKTTRAHWEAQLVVADTHHLTLRVDAITDPSSPDLNAAIITGEHITGDDHELLPDLPTIVATIAALHHSTRPRAHAAGDDVSSIVQSSAEPDAAPEPAAPGPSAADVHGGVDVAPHSSASI